MNNRTTFLDFAVVGAALFLYPRTADILSFFSPENLNQIIGQDVSIIYGLGTALLVEGGGVDDSFLAGVARSPAAQWVKWALLAVSGICQVFDGMIINDTLASQTDTIKLAFQYGVPLVPLLIVVMIFGIGQLPEMDSPRKPFVGLKNIPAQFGWIWRGSNAGQPVAKRPPSQPYQSQPQAGGKNGNQPEPVNPTKPPHD